MKNSQSLYDLASLSTRVNCLVMSGVVGALKGGTVRIIVYPNSEQEFVTEWLPWTGMRSGGNRVWNPPELNERVLILAPSGRLNNGWVLPGGFTDDFPLPCDNPDVVKEIYLHEKVGVMEYNRRTGVRRFRIHAEGQFRQEVGIFEDTGKTGTSEIIQSRDAIQLRVGNTAITIRDGEILFCVNGKTYNRINEKGITESVGGTGIRKLRAKEASSGVLSSPYEKDKPVPDFIGTIADERGVHAEYKGKSILQVNSDGITAEHRGQKPARHVVGNGVVMSMTGTSHHVVSQEMIESRMTGSRITMLPLGIELESTDIVTTLKPAQGATYFKGPSNVIAPPTAEQLEFTFAPPELTKEVAPSVPKD